MKCEKCGSDNMQATVQSSTKFKNGHGCLWFILFGWWYFAWIGIKWMFKYMIVMMWYLCVEWERAIVLAIKKKPYSKPLWITRLLRKRGKAYTEHQTVFICNNCGHKQKMNDSEQS